MTNFRIMTRDTVSIANIPSDLIKDILTMYAEKFEFLKSQTKHDYSELLSQYASEWEQDRSYGPDFELSRITGKFLSDIYYCWGSMEVVNQTIL